MELCYGLFIGGATALLRTPVVSLFVTGPSAQAVVELGARYLGAMAVFYLLPAFTNGFQGYFRGMGRLGGGSGGGLATCSAAGWGGGGAGCSRSYSFCS